jgi:hypothetical protein
MNFSGFFPIFPARNRLSFRRLCCRFLAVLLCGAAGLAGPALAVNNPSAPIAIHKVRAQGPEAAKAIAAQGGKLVADYGSFQLFQVTTLDPAVTLMPGVEVQDDNNLVELNAITLNTTAPAVQALRQSQGKFAGKRLHLVQFSGPVQPAWRDELVQTGARIIAYIPENAYLIYGDTTSLGQAQALAGASSHIQWDAPYADDYKIQPAARTVDAAGNPREIGTDLFVVQLVADPAANAATLQLLDQTKLGPVKQQESVLEYLNVTLPLSPADLARVAAQPEVVSIAPFFVPKLFCERQDQIIAGNLNGNVPSGPGYLAWLTGKGFTPAEFAASSFGVDLSDSGIDNGTTSPNHPGLYVTGTNTNPSRIFYNRLVGTPNPGSTNSGCDGHGTLNAHIIGGYNNKPAGFPHTDSAGYHPGLGTCPFVKIGSSVIFDPNYTFPNFTTLQSSAYHDGARVSNNSWGGGTAGAYNTTSQTYDALVRDAQPAGSPFATAGNQEMVIIFSAGNSGPGAGTVRSAATAKNTISVGGGENVQAFGGADASGVDDSMANSANDIVSFSSRGPCADGRHKPEIVAPASHVSGGVPQAPNAGPLGSYDPCFDASGVSGCSVNSQYWPFYPDSQLQNLYTASSGTSHAAPCVSGACALLRQYFINNGNTPPSPAMTKAYLMNSARYMTGVSANDTLWSDNQGMGELNLGTAFDGTSRMLRDELASDMFTASGQTRIFHCLVTNSSAPFRVTLAWTDAPGSTTGAAYNNNLDLTVTIGTNIYKGNVFSGAYSVTGGSADAKNNVESVFLPAGVSGPVTVTVTAANITSDGVPNTGGSLDQDFAMVIYNAIPAPPSVDSIQPTNLKVVEGQSASFTVNASGSPPISYQWKKSGSAIAGATTSIYTIASAVATNSGSYSVTVSDVNGTTGSSNVNLIVVPTVPLPYALNNSTLTWVTNPATPWYGQTNISEDGVASAQSYFIGDNQQSILRTTVSGPGVLSFWWKVSSETNADVLSVGFGSTTAASISGEVNWQSQFVYLPAGSQTVQWTYSKNATNSAGQDAGWVDLVNFTNGVTPATILAQPTDQSSFGGSPVTFSVTAGGTPPLAYQWRFNGANISGATASALNIPSPGPGALGLYSVRVTNAYGSVLSSNAALGVVPLLAYGDNSLGQISVSALATNAIAVSAGAWHTLALGANGTVLAWGNNSDGQATVPGSLDNAVGIAAGGYHSLALRADGTVTGWGANYNGQATPPAGLRQVNAIAAGSWHSLALLASGTVVAWGDDTYGQIDVPADLTNVIAIAAGGNHSLALRADGTVAAWGENTDDQGFYSGQSTVPPGLGTVVALGAGDYHSLVVQADGTVVSWGSDSDGQVETPAGLSGVAAVAGGGAHSVALRTNTTVAGWGANWNGQIAFAAGVSNIVAVTAGNAHTVMLIGDAHAAPRLSWPLHTGSQFSVLVQTFPGRNYTLESKDSLTAGTWSSVATVLGNGNLQFLRDPAASGPQRYYRVRQW